MKNYIIKKQQVTEDVQLVHENNVSIIVEYVI